MLTMSPFQLWERKISAALSGPAWDAKYIRMEDWEGRGRWSQQSITCRTLMSLQSSQGQHQHPSRFDWLQHKSSQKFPEILSLVLVTESWSGHPHERFGGFWFHASLSEPQPQSATTRNKKFPTRHSVGWDDTAWQMEILSRNVRNFHKNNFTRFAENWFIVAENLIIIVSYYMPGNLGNLGNHYTDAAWLFLGWNCPT